MHNALTWTDLKAVHDHFARIAVEICNGGEEVSPQVFVLGELREGKAGKMAAVPAALLEQFFAANEAGKDALGEFIRGMLTERHPVREHFKARMGFEPGLLVQIGECWAAFRGDTPDFDEYLDGTRGASQSHSRVEVVLVTVHSPMGSIPVMHRIESAPKRHAVLAEFPEKDESMLFGGRLTVQDDQQPRGTTH